MFCNALNSHPDIVCFHEAFTPSRDAPTDFNVVLQEKIDGLVASGQPIPKFIGLHGQYENLNDQIHIADVPKIHLFRKDEIRGGMRQCLMGLRRVDKGFDLDVDIANNATQVRQKRTKEMKTYSTLDVVSEKLMRKDSGKIRFWQTVRILNHLGARHSKLTSSIKPEGYEPRNMEELYARESQRRRCTSRSIFKR